VGRSYADYAEDGLPDAMYEATKSKVHVKGRRLRGVAPAVQLKILKELPLAEYRTVKRAIVTAHRLRHPGVVPVECAFVAAVGDMVVVQSPFYAGGNLRQWCTAVPVKGRRARLVAAQRLAAAVAFLHASQVLHRDIKPENVVFASADEDATPALCDFDLCQDLQQTRMQTTMRGSPLCVGARCPPHGDATKIINSPIVA